MERGLAPILAEQIARRVPPEGEYGYWDALKYAMPGLAFGTKVMTGLDQKIGYRERKTTLPFEPVLAKPMLRGSVKRDEVKEVELFSPGYGKNSGKKNPYITIGQYERKTNKSRKVRRRKSRK